MNTPPPSTPPPESTPQPPDEPLVQAPSQPPSAPTAMTVLRNNWGWAAAAVGFLVLLYYLGPILMPFVVGAGLAYLGDPLVDRLEDLRFSRTGGVCVVFVVVIGVIALAMLLLVPLLQQQINQLLQNLPQWLHWMQEKGLPTLGIHLPGGLKLDGDSLRKVLERNWHDARGLLTSVLGRLGRSTPAVLATVANLLLIPIVAFYLLRDWDLMVARIRDLIPPQHQPRADRLAQETNSVLSGLIRGQLLVMAALAVIYSTGLWIAGLKVALLIGFGAGLLSFIPYLGFISGLLFASIAMLIQTQHPLSLLWVLLVFGVGEIMESAVLTPMLIGDRIGLHPVAVIFAILAGGQLFGFVGVLLALPVSAVLAVLLRHAGRHWLASSLYRVTDAS